MSKKIFLIFLMLLSFVMTNCSKDEELLVPERTFYNFPLNKLWAHRVNTVDDANHAFEEFDGIETDIRFLSDLNEFQTGHDSASGLSLKSFFEGINECSNHYYWLDFKNLSEDNADLALQELKDLMSLFHLENKIIIESYHAELLSKFKSETIFTSLWVEEINAVIPVIAIRQLAQRVKEDINNFGFDAISCSYTMNDFVQKYFSKYNVHLWTNGLSGDSGREIIHNLALNQNVKIILVDYDENFMR